MLKFTLTLFTLFFSLSAFSMGGDELGNGGDILYCSQNGARSYQVLDFSEIADYRFGFSLREFPDYSDLLETAFFTALKSRDPGRACLYSRWNKEFFKDAIVTQEPVYDLADEGLVMIPKHCKIVQTIVQHQSSSSIKRKIRYFVYGPFFFKLNPLHMLGLKMHEFIYREGIAMNRTRFKNSLGVRTFNAFLFSKRMLVAPQADYDDFVESLGLPVSEDYCNPAHPIHQK